MFKPTSVLAVAIMALSPVAAQAAQRTAVLTVEKATCSLCAPIVKRALSSTRGVTSVKVAEANGDTPAVATVTYNDSITNVAKLMKATTNAGYSSHLRK